MKERVTKDTKTPRASRNGSAKKGKTSQPKNGVDYGVSCVGGRREMRSALDVLAGRRKIPDAVPKSQPTEKPPTMEGLGENRRTPRTPREGERVLTDLVKGSCCGNMANHLDEVNQTLVEKRPPQRLLQRRDAFVTIGKEFSKDIQTDAKLLGLTPISLSLAKLVSVGLTDTLIIDGAHGRKKDYGGKDAQTLAAELSRNGLKAVHRIELRGCSTGVKYARALKKELTTQYRIQVTEVVAPQYTAHHREGDARQAAITEEGKKREKAAKVANKDFQDQNLKSSKARILLSRAKKKMAQALTPEEHKAALNEVKIKELKLKSAQDDYKRHRGKSKYFAARLQDLKDRKEYEVLAPSHVSAMEKRIRKIEEDQKRYCSADVMKELQWLNSEVEAVNKVTEAGQNPWVSV
ncbi:MAG: hypothetical protein J7647_17005 [Cyanobacteria bacterium SBLK]|nr:hypothetical protein [Cyanobacteria bacterium SBLK]